MISHWDYSDIRFCSLWTYKVIWDDVRLTALDAGILTIVIHVGGFREDDVELHSLEDET